MVNTFVVHSDPTICAQALDNRRLGKQRVEAYQLINDLLGITAYRVNHPATQSWIGHVDALKHYTNAMITEWIRRGGQNNMELYSLTETPVYPPWFSNPRVQFAFQAALLRKEPTFYQGRFQVPEEYMSRDYIWPCYWSMEQLDTLPLEQLTQPAKELFFCEATKADGARCINPALYSGFCGVHKPKDWIQPICDWYLSPGRPCTFKAQPNNGGRCKRHTVHFSIVR